MVKTSCRSVFVSQTGRLLVGTTHGLFIYQESAFRKVLFGSNALSSINFITGIVEGYKDTFWLTKYAGATGSLLIALLIFTIQLIFSRWWLARHKQGPLEFLWRKGTWI